MADLFDSNIVIDALKGIPEALTTIGSEERPSISVVTRIEVLAGCPDETSMNFARSLLATFRVFGLTPAIEAEAVNVRRTARVKLPDAIILATARVHGLTLATRNTKDFSPDDPGVRIPYEL